MAQTRLRTAALAAATALTLLGTAAPAVAAAPVAAPSTKRPVVHDEQITFQDWSRYPDWRRGTHAGTRAVPGLRPGVTLARPLGTTDYTDPHTGITKSWEYATWTSPVTRIGFDATELIASWNANTPAGTWIQVEMQGTYNTGVQTKWYVMGRWASGDADIKRTSVNRQGDPWSTIWTDTFSIDDASVGVLLRDYQLRLTLYRTPGQRAAPVVHTVGAMSSNVPDRFTVEPSAGRIAWGRELRVPRYSQNVHAGHYPEYDGGGQAWCSPTSTTMVIEYWGRKASEEDTSWVDPTYPDPTVNHAARMVYDYQYDGAGNWPFNTAYAASFPGLEARVTRLHSLDEVERFIAAGIPVVTSQSFLASELDGAGYGTAGHLFVVVGFTADGDVIVNDPASLNNESVRNVYKREQFEQIWLRTKRTNASGGVSGGSGGVAYLIKPTLKPWPKVSGSTNW
ncbi:C39 family peptidase [Micromonospora peucetia]|uniref:C39 family peptidase n=1 Tax=Micromonospora peucetia TaxID=47871 RepID=A0A1C6UR26_9ACTN|nr:C39 family peptidase [Micromonospora peucetia]MCX4387220.1 C39 family peptidase [Micromonospora peucetia]WSA34648.1 C39 family peptidase [Micromonospora peucetia]SCL56343.1 Peptidase_C39 like family protein [Micromonospora peucetia]